MIAPVGTTLIPCFEWKLDGDTLLFECPEQTVDDVLGVPPKCNIRTQEENCGPREEPPRSTNHHDKSPLRRYLSDNPDAEPRLIQYHHAIASRSAPIGGRPTSPDSTHVRTVIYPDRMVSTSIFFFGDIGDGMIR
jgi:hypothetical protein